MQKYSLKSYDFTSMLTTSALTGGEEKRRKVFTDIGMPLHGIYFTRC